MFNKILTQTEVRIAVRIIRACREMGIRTVAVYSEADKDVFTLFWQMKPSVLAPAPSSQSYLNMERILSATVAMKADAIHPGFGFLSENARFAKLCQQCNITFIGPSAEIINRMGNKSEARNSHDTGWSSCCSGRQRACIHSRGRSCHGKGDRFSGYDKGFLRWRWKGNAYFQKRRGFYRAVLMQPS